MNDPNQHKKNVKLLIRVEQHCQTGLFVFLSPTLFSCPVNVPLRANVPAVGHTVSEYLVVSPQRRGLESLK